MISWLKSLLFKRCPECGSFRVVDCTDEVITFTYNIYYSCLDCGNRWHEGGL